MIKNKKIYKLFFKLELKRLQYKSLVYNLRIPKYIRQHSFLCLSKISSSSSYTMIRQRCFISNNGRSVSNHFKLSRIKLRLLISNNYINGVKKLN
jgi:ribosomal protein S14